MPDALAQVWATPGEVPDGVQVEVVVTEVDAEANGTPAETAVWDPHQDLGGLDEETIRTADHIVDIGPGAGEHGGRVVAEGSLDVIAAACANDDTACSAS